MYPSWRYNWGALCTIAMHCDDAVGGCAFGLCCGGSENRRMNDWHRFLAESRPKQYTRMWSILWWNHRRGVAQSRLLFPLIILTTQVSDVASSTKSILATIHPHTDTGGG